MRGGSTELNDAELPYQVLRRDGTEMRKQAFVQELSRARAVCVGERHDNAHHHWAQWQILGWLIRENARRGVETALGMEMFQRPFQGVLDDHWRGNIDERDMLARAGWEERWGFDWGLYSPLVRTAVGAGARVLALNLSTELRKKISAHGVAELSEEDRAKLPAHDVTYKPHRDWWDGIMEAMGGHHGHHGGEQKKIDPEKAKARAERSYSVQVLWDETMADTAHRWLAEKAARQVVVVAGNGHCHDSGIVARLKRRGEKQGVSVRPVLADRVPGRLAAPENDYLFVLGE